MHQTGNDIVAINNYKRNANILDNRELFFIESRVYIPGSYT